MKQGDQNNDKKIYTVPNKDWKDEGYMPYLFITPEGALGINVAGNVIVKRIEEWFSIAKQNEFKRGEAIIQTVSLKTAKELKEAGFKQKTIYFWMVNPRPISERTKSEMEAFLTIEGESRNFKDERCSAPTTDEILMELPVEALAQMWLWLKKGGLLEDKK